MNVAEKVLQLKQDFDAVYEAGKQSGGGNTDEAFENGKKEIMRCITCDYTRTVYNNAFQYTDLKGFYPYGNIKPTNAGYMFANTRNGEKINLNARLAECGGTLDFSNAANMQRAFYVSGVTNLGVIDCTATTNLAYLYCSSTYLKSIDEMKVHSGNTYQSSFDACSALEEIRFSEDSVIGNNIDFSACEDLSHDSIINDSGTGVINVLAVLESGVTRTLSLGKNLEKLSDTEKAVATQKGWTLA